MNSYLNNITSNLGVDSDAKDINLPLPYLIVKVLGIPFHPELVTQIIVGTLVITKCVIAL